MKYIAKIHYQSTPFNMTYIKAECELDEDGDPKQDKEYVYLKDVKPISRRSIKTIEFIPVPEAE